jgi:ERCC4-type nuclease
MKIIIDERERDLYDVLQNNMGIIPIEKTVLTLGDILLTNNDGLESDNANLLDKPILIFERKTIADLLASIKDGRYEEQSYRLIHTSQISLHNIVYIIEGTMANLRNPNERQLVLSAITSLNYFKGFSVFRTQSVIETGVLIKSMAEKIDRDLKKGKIPIYLSAGIDSNDDMSTATVTATVNTAANVVTPYCSVVKKVKKDNITTKNIGEIVLCQIPGISSVTAVAIMSRFSSFLDFIDTIRNNSAALDNITYETNGKTRKISSACVKSIRTFLLNDTENKIECI